MDRFQDVSMIIQEGYTGKLKSELCKSINAIDKVIKSLFYVNL